MVNGNMRYYGGNNARGSGLDEKELASKTLQIQNKRFYLDVKQNNRGKFIKIAEVGVTGHKSRILMSLPTTADFRDKLTTLNDFYNDLPPHNIDNLSEDGRIKSDSIIRDNRRYYLDLKENQRGRFLRVTMMNLTVRSQIAIPAQGMIELRNSLSELYNEFSKGENVDEEGGVDLPKPRSMRAEGKMFYFDVGSNRRGVFLRISEVHMNYRTAINIPERFWGKFRDVIQDLAANTHAKTSSNATASGNVQEETASSGDTKIKQEEKETPDS